jgi:hypothetical protein
VSDWILNPEWEHAQFVSISELKECQNKLKFANERIKRLEEGGGLALGYASKGDFESADEVWLKAKEAKL